MIQNLLFDWLHLLDKYIGEKSSVKILLLVNNCSAHGSWDNLPLLKIFHIELLPPNATSKVQPLYAGIISLVKSKYRRRF